MRGGRGRRRVAGRELEVEIDSLGFQGDGIAHRDGERLIVPLAMPGERWRVWRQGSQAVVAPLACLEPSPDRVAPVCRHFGKCGGCRLQHLPAALYDRCKLGQIEGALAARGLVPPGPIALHRSPLASRRRLRLAFAGDGGLGFRRRGSRAVVAIRECPIARPSLARLLTPLGRLLRGLAAAKGGAEATLTELDDGVELVLHLGTRPDLAGHEALAGFAETEALVRLAITVGEAAPEPVAARLPAILTIAGTPIALPPAAFLQATQEGEAALQRFVVAELATARRVADLFAGVGTLGLPLAAKGALVQAFDAAPELVAAIRHPRVRAEGRDLVAAPLQADELLSVDAVVLDPPRAGAAAQASVLAESAVPRIAYVSCDAASFARDAAMLVAGGFRLAALEAVDQFVFSSEIELAAAFAKA